jgi:hypothetical protein
MSAVLRPYPWRVPRLREKAVFGELYQVVEEAIVPPFEVSAKAWEVQ